MTRSPGLGMDFLLDNRPGQSGTQIGIGKHAVLHHPADHPRIVFRSDPGQEFPAVRRKKRHRNPGLGQRREGPRVNRHTAMAAEEIEAFDKDRRLALAIVFFVDDAAGVVRQSPRPDHMRDRALPVPAASGSAPRRAAPNETNS